MDRIAELEQENKILRVRVVELERENQQLHKTIEFLEEARADIAEESHVFSGEFGSRD